MTFIIMDSTFFAKDAFKDVLRN